MPQSANLRPAPGVSSALVLLVFAGGSTLDAMLRVISLYSPVPGSVPLLFLAAVPTLIAIGTWICLRGRRQLAGPALLQLPLALAVGVLTMTSPLPLSWYLGLGLVLWAMKLRHNVSMWVGTSLLVLAGGASFGMIEFQGVLFLPFVLTPPLLLGAAAYYQWHQVRHGNPESDPGAEAAAELQRKRYGRDPGH